MDDIVKKINRLEIETKVLLEKTSSDLREIEEKYSIILADINTLEKVKEVLNNASENSRKEAIAIIENTVTPMLQAIMGDKYKFKVENSILRGKPAIDFYIITTVDGEESKQDLMKFSGGGFVDTVSTALRYAFLNIYDGGINGPAILDEPARMISQNVSSEYAEFVKYLGDTFGRQTIMCTHSAIIARYADKAIEVTKPIDCSVINYI